MCSRRPPSLLPRRTIPEQFIFRDCDPFSRREDVRREEELEGVASHIGDGDDPQGIDGDAERELKLAHPRSPAAERLDEPPVAGEALDASVLVIDDEDVAGRVDRHREWLVELAVTAALAAKGADEVPVAVQDLNAVIE